jgi:hypothetical protein
MIGGGLGLIRTSNLDAFYRTELGAPEPCSRG